MTSRQNDLNEKLDRIINILKKIFPDNISYPPERPKYEDPVCSLLTEHWSDEKICAYIVADCLHFLGGLNAVEQEKLIRAEKELINSLGEKTWEKTLEFITGLDIEVTDLPFASPDVKAIYKADCISDLASIRNYLESPDYNPVDLGSNRGLVASLGEEFMLAAGGLPALDQYASALFSETLALLDRRSAEFAGPL